MRDVGLFLWPSETVGVLEVKSVRLTADISPSASYLEKSKVAPSPSNQGCLLLVGPSFVGFLHSGLAPWARCHPPSMAGGSSRRIHAARPTERDLRSACTQVAIGGVWALCARRSKAWSRSKASRLKPVLLTARGSNCRTGFSREGAGVSTLPFAECTLMIVPRSAWACIPRRAASLFLKRWAVISIAPC